ncbi:hypothetical protein [Methanobrevibacter sp.]|uniref:hypothetical protein n=1 Tax=Methanobrevibacter sp. TaxID=66852 RepID=UPI0038904B17
MLELILGIPKRLDKQDIEEVKKEEDDKSFEEQKAYWADDDNNWGDKSLLDAYKNLSTLIFQYNEKGVELDPTQDTSTVHTGVSAQEVSEIPELKSAVRETPDGIKMLDIRELCTSNTAAIAEIARRIEKIEKYLSKGE